MSALLIAISAGTGTVLGWFVYRASLRIQAWGVNMDAQDRIFQEAVGENSADMQIGRERTEAERGAVAVLHLPLGAVSSK